MRILSAKYLLPISSGIIQDGAVAFRDDEIVEVGLKDRLTKKFPTAVSEDFGKAVIMPGLVNCHSHLEITAMRGFLDSFDDDFSSWLVKLTKTRADILTDEDIKISALFGALEGVKAGVTCFGDIGRFGLAGLEALRKSGLRGVLFQETDFLPDNLNAEEGFQTLREKFLALCEFKTPLVEIGISPHAPYTVSEKLFEKIVRYAIEENIKITIHASESKEELSLMRDGKGFFADIYRDQNVKWESPNCSSIEYFSRIGVLNSKPLLAHCVTASKKEIELLKESDSRIAHCPKSNAKFGHGIAPFESFLDHDIKVGVGSDSVASNNSCDIFEEIRFAALIARTREESKRFIHAKEAIETATLGGAKALGLEDRIGTLEKGKQADMIVVSLDEAAQTPVHDAYATLLFSSNAHNVVRTIVAGEDIFKDGKATNIDETQTSFRMSEIAEKMKKNYH